MPSPKNNKPKKIATHIVISFSDGENKFDADIKTEMPDVEQNSNIGDLLPSLIKNALFESGIIKTMKHLQISIDK